MDLKIQDYICPGKRAHLVGVGGVSMSPLAQVLHGAGVVVTGSDMHESAEVAHLRALGIPVTIGHLPRERGRGRLRHPHRRRPRRQPGDRRRPRRRHPRVRAGPGLGRPDAPL
ncbi:MAG: Mur ligase domain-containing protein [Lawsonibacter sp.]